MELPQWLGKIGYHDQVEVTGARGVRWQIVAIRRSICKIDEYLRRRLGFRGRIWVPHLYVFSYSWFPPQFWKGSKFPLSDLRTSDNSISSLLSPVSSQLLSHFFILIPSVRLLCFPLCFLSPFRFLLSFFPFRHLLCLSYAINLFWSDRGNQQPAMSRMVRHDLSRKKRFRAILHTEKAKKAPAVPQGSPDVAPRCPIGSIFFWHDRLFRRFRSFRLLLLFLQALIISHCTSYSGHNSYDLTSAFPSL